MVTLSEILRWFTYRINTFWLRFAGAVMRRDRLLLGSERKFRGLLESAADAIVIVNWHGHIELINARTEEMFGYKRSELIGQHMAELMPERFRDAHHEHMKRYIRSPQPRPMGRGLELFGRSKDGTEFPVEISISPLETDGGLLVSAAIRDVTERKHDEQQLRHLADHDALTGLVNRRSFEERLGHEVEMAGRSHLEGVMLLMDIDGLKDVNDTLGHAQGDELIRSIGEVIEGRMRRTDVTARIGGDEFAVVMPNTGIEAAEDVANELLLTIRNHGIVLGAQRLRPSACAGIAAFGIDGVEPRDVMVDADLALYAAKSGGRNRVAVHRPERTDGGQEVRTPWSQRIRNGLDENRFVPYRQPIMSLPDRSINRYELLVRLLDEHDRPIAPGAFLPAAERSGLVPEIDKRMAYWAIDLIARSEASEKPLSYEVNLSARTLSDRGVTAQIAQRVKDSGVDPSLLVFEITETAAIANVGEARDAASTLREVGCQFALDDFGAGFASFLYLKHLPLDALKIDGDFVCNLRRNETDQLLVKHMAEIAADLGLLTIAEYVEDAETLEMAASYGIDAVQGFHIGRPEPVPGLEGGVLFERPSRELSSTA